MMVPTITRIRIEIPLALVTLEDVLKPDLPEHEAMCRVFAEGSYHLKELFPQLLRPFIPSSPSLPSELYSR